MAEDAPATQMVQVTVTQGLTKRQVFMWFLRVLRVILVIAVLLDMAAYVLCLVGAILGDSLPTEDRVFIVLASLGYMMVCTCIIIGEFPPEWFLKKVQIFDFWGFRGAAVAWQGVQTIYSVSQLSIALAGNDNDRVDATKQVGTICGYILIGIGGLYILLSAMCLRDVLKLDLPLQWRGDEPILEGGRATLMVPVASTSYSPPDSPREKRGARDEI